MGNSVCTAGIIGMIISSAAILIGGLTMAEAYPTQYLKLCNNVLYNKIPIFQSS
jgi:hypothetical protein